MVFCNPNTFRAVIAGLATLAITLVVIGAGVHDASAQDAIEVNPTAVTLSSGETTTILLPYTVAADKDASTLTVIPFALTQQGVPIEWNSEGPISIDLNLEAKILTITVDNDALDRAGAYHARFQATVEPKKAEAPAGAPEPATEPDAEPAAETVAETTAEAEPAVEIFSLAMTRPAATLVLPAQAIEIERGVWFHELARENGDGATDDPGRLRKIFNWFTPDRFTDTEDENPPILIATGPTARVLELRARPVDTEDVYVIAMSSPTESGKAIADLLGGESPLDPNTVFELHEDIVGETPLGTIDRTVRLESPQLAQPVDVTFKVTTRRSRLLIPLLSVLGIALGWLTRRLPEWLRRRLDALNRAGEVREICEGILAKPTHSDPELRDLACKYIEDGKWFARKLHSAEHNNSEADQAIAKINARVALLRPRIKAESDRYAAEAAIARPAWNLPPRTISRLQTSNAHLVEADRAAKKSDPVAYTAALELSQTNQINVRSALIEDRDRIETGLTALVAVVAQIQDPSPTSRALLVNAKAGKQSLDALPSGTADLLKELKAMDVATRYSRIVSGDLKRLITDRQAVLQLDANEETDSDKTAAIEERITELDGAIETLRKPGGFLKLDNAAEALKKDLDKAAAIRRHELAQQANASKSAPPDVLRSPRAQAPAPAPPEPAAATVASAEVLDIADLAPPGSLFKIDAARAVLGGTSRLLGFVRMLVLLALVTATAYGWMSRDWVGTLAQVVTVFVWAYGVDLSTELLTKTRATDPFTNTVGGAPPKPKANPTPPQPAPADH